MAQKLSVQYIRYYTDGSAARKIAPAAPERQPKALPKQRRQKTKTYNVYLLPTIGILMAGIMLLMMAVGMIRLSNANAEIAEMESYITQLSAENAELSARYSEGYDLEKIRQTALALDMVPMEQVQQITITIPADMPEPEPVTLWEQIGTFLSGLFA